MMKKLLFAGAGIAAVVVTVLACGDSDPSDSPSDGGPDGSSESEGSTDARPEPLLLKAGVVVPIGVTPDGMVICWALDGSLEAIPVTGGSPVKIATIPSSGEALPIRVSGGAVAWWTNVTGGIGTINVWNATDGVKTGLSTASVVGGVMNAIFAASADGRRVSFSTGATAQITNLQVVDVGSTTPMTGGMLPDEDAVDLSKLQDGSCVMDMRFVGKKLLAAFCASDGARAYVVPDNSTTAVRFDDKGKGAGPIRVFWRADDVGNKLYVLGDTAAESRLIDVSNVLPDAAAITSVRVFGGAEEGFVTKDGTAVVYRLGTQVKRFAPKPDGDGGLIVDGGTTLAENVSALFYPTNDQSRVLISRGMPVEEYRTIDTTTPGQTTPAIANGGVFPLGFTGSGSHFVFGVGVPGNLSLNAAPSAGGGEKHLATAIASMFLAPEGDGVTVLLNGVPDPVFLNSYELRLIDVATGTSLSLTDGVVDHFIVFAGRKPVYLRVKEPGAGMYVVDPK